MNGLRAKRIETPVGTLTLIEDDSGLVAVRLPGQTVAGAAPAAFAAGRIKDQEAEAGSRPDEVERLECPAEEQLQAYFAGRLRDFDLPLAARGTPFQQRVWQALTDIGYGETVSYLELAERLGDAKGVRAVASANARNPLPIVVPCHRVVASDGSLTGYVGGLEMKRQLLELERLHTGPGPLFSASRSA